MRIVKFIKEDEKYLHVSGEVYGVIDTALIDKSNGEILISDKHIGVYHKNAPVNEIVGTNNTTINFRGIRLNLNDADFVVMNLQREHYIKMMQYKEISHDFKNMLKDYVTEIDTIFNQAQKGGANG